MPFMGVDGIAKLWLFGSAFCSWWYLEYNWKLLNIFENVHTSLNIIIYGAVQECREALPIFIEYVWMAKDLKLLEILKFL
jgi:hypothetical protein